MRQGRTDVVGPEYVFGIVVRLDWRDVVEPVKIRENVGKVSPESFDLLGSQFDPRQFGDVTDRLGIDARLAHVRSEPRIESKGFGRQSQAPTPKPGDMETTRHFTATMFVVHDGETVLHEHERLGLWLPPGGHLDRDELPHEAALREAEEETGLEVSLWQEPTGTESPTAVPLPMPAQLLLEDINISPDGVGHQHIDFIYFGRATDRQLAPATGEVDSDRWSWFSADELRADNRFDRDIVALGCRAIDYVAP